MKISLYDMRGKKGRVVPAGILFFFSKVIGDQERLRGLL